MINFRAFGSDLPAAPTSATRQQVSATIVELSWGAPAGIDGFVIVYATAAGDTITSVELPADQTSYQVTNLDETTEYQFYLYSQTNGLRAGADMTVVDPGSNTGTTTPAPVTTTPGKGTKDTPNIHSKCMLWSQFTSFSHFVSINSFSYFQHLSLLH